MGRGRWAAVSAERRVLVAIVLLLAGAGTETLAQEPGAGEAFPRVRVEIRQVAGSNVYLDLGTDDGVAAGDTLAVRRAGEGEVVGRLAVVAATAVRSVLTFVDDPFPLATGETVFLQLARAPARPPSPSAGAARVPEVPGGPASAPPPPARASGRVSLEVAVNRSTTALGVVEPEDVTRTYATPALRMDATVPGFLAGFTLRARTRVSHRYSSGTGFTRPTSAQVHQLSLERRFTAIPLRLTLGRFYSPAESFSGFWDGVAVRVGGPAFGAGLVAGLEPDYWSQEPSLDLPKATVFVDHALRRDGWRWDGDVSAHLVAPRLDGMERHVFLGVGQRLEVGAVRLRGEVQLDRDPGPGSVRVSEGVAQATLTLSQSFSLRAGGSRRERYSVYGGLDPFGPRRDRLAAGFSLRSGGMYLSADQGWNRYGGTTDRLSWTGSLSLARLPGLAGVGWSASGTYWKGDADHALTAGTAVNFHLRSARFRVGYRLHRSTILGRDRTTHAPDLSVDAPVPGGLSLAIRTSTQWGDRFTGQHLSVSLTRVFR